MLNIVSILIILGIYIAPFLFKDIAEPIFTKSAYFFMAGLFLWWLYTLWNYSKDSFTDFFKNSSKRLPVIIGLLATIFCFTTNEISFKTNSDETNLLGISHSMFYSNEVFNETMGKYYYGNLNITNVEVPKRPLFFPFLTTVIHNFIGYSKHSPFVVNFLLLWGIFIIVLQGFTKFSKIQMLGVTFLVLSQPLIGIYATSAGFDIASLFFFILATKLTWEYSKRGDVSTWNVLIATLAIYSNIRYEGILFAGLFGLYLLINKHINFKKILMDGSIKLLVLFYFPQILQRILSVGSYENPDDRGVFSLIALKEHLILMGRSLTDFFGILPYNSFLNFLVPVFIVGLVYLAVKRKAPKYLLFLAIVTIINTLLFLAHHAGLYDHPTQARFFLVYCSFALVGFHYFFYNASFIGNNRDLKFLIASFGMFLVFNPVANEGRFMNKLVINRDLRYIYDFIDNQKEPDILYVYDRPGQITAINRGAVTYSYAKENWNDLMSNLKSGLFSRIIIIEELDYKDDPASAVYNGSQFTQLKKFQSTSDDYLRVLEIHTKETP